MKDDKTSTEFVKMETYPRSEKTRSAKIFVLGAALLFSLAANAFLVFTPKTNCPETQADKLDSCLVSLEGSDDRIMNCLLQRAQEMSIREEAIGDCVTELKATETELSMYKKNEEDNVDNMSEEAVAGKHYLVNPGLWTKRRHSRVFKLEAPLRNFAGRFQMGQTRRVLSGGTNPEPVL